MVLYGPNEQPLGICQAGSHFRAARISRSGAGEQFTCMIPRPDTLSPDAVFYAAEEHDWVLRADCPACRGYRLGLRVPDPGKRLLAEVRASAFLEGVHSTACLGCQARARRNGEVKPESELDVWWDPSAGEWMAPLPGAQGVAVPLGVRSYWARQEARAAARALGEAGFLPLRVAAEPAEVDPDACTVYYDLSSARWRLRIGCFECGGFELRLVAPGRGNVDLASAEALRCLERVADEGCPGCRSQAERAGAEEPADEPRLWFDTTAGEWVVSRPLGEPGESVTLPLGIGRYDADEGQLLRAAAELLFGGRHRLGRDGDAA
jgi:hypothetical protein